MADEGDPEDEPDSKTLPEDDDIESYPSPMLSNTLTSGSELQSISNPSSSDSNSQSKNTMASTSNKYSEEIREALEEKSSKSQEELSTLESLPSSAKKTSLDELNKLQKCKKLYRQCHRSFREIIGKRELKNEELEKQTGDLQKRLNILECAMPAVMVWNIWRMSQGAPVPCLKRVLEKQFEGPASGEVYCPSTPSRHFDCRVREVEAERKQALTRVEEARALWTEKMAALEDRNKRLQGAKAVQEETKKKIEDLTAEARKLKDAVAKEIEDGSCETGDCGVIECKKKWLEKVPSNASIRSTDIECLQKLQELAEDELAMKRQIADLESREEAYMRTLQQADELWSKLDSDVATSVDGLQDQLNMKTAANQQMATRICELEDVVEDLMARLSTCKGELTKYMSVTTVEALIGREDDYAGILHKAVLTSADQSEQGSLTDPVNVRDKALLVKGKTMERDVMARVAMGDAQQGIRPEDFESESLQQAAAYLAEIGSLSELDKGDDDFVCDFSCNDLVLTETGLTEEEMRDLAENKVTVKMLMEKTGMDVDAELAAMRGELETEAGEAEEEVIVREVAKEEVAEGLMEVVEEEVEEYLEVREEKVEEGIIEEVETAEETGTVEGIEIAEEIAQEVSEEIKATEEVAAVEDVAEGIEDAEEILAKVEFAEEVPERSEPAEEIERAEKVSAIVELVEEAVIVEEVVTVREDTAEVEPSRELEEVPVAEKVELVLEAETIESIAPIKEIDLAEEGVPPAKIEPVEESAAVERIRIHEAEPVERTEVAEEVAAVAPIAVAEEATPVERVKVQEEAAVAPAVVAEQAAPIERVAVAEQAAPIERVAVAEQAAPIERVAVAEQAAPIERITVTEEAKPVEQIKVAEEAVPIEQIKIAEEAAPVERVKVAEVPAPIEQIKVAEVPAPIEQIKVAEGPAPIEQIKVAEEPASIERIRVAEEAVPAERIKVAEEPAPIEQIKVAEEPVPVERIQVAEEAVPVERIQVAEDLKEAKVAVVTEIVDVATEPAPIVSDERDIVVPINEMLSWRDGVDLIRSTIAQCDRCVIVKKDADQLASKMAAFTGMEVKQIDRRPGPQSEALPGGTEKVEVKQETLDGIETPEDATEQQTIPKVAGELKETEEAKTVGLDPASRPEFEAEQEKPTKGETSVAPSIKEPEEYSTLEEEIVCTCPLFGPGSGPAKKIEITQTEIATVEKIQAVTQTVKDVATQTLPSPCTRIVPTRALDQESEMLSRILGSRFPQAEQVAATTSIADGSQKKMATTIQTRSRKTAAAGKRLDGPRFGPEQEIRSVYYGKKPGEMDEGRCSCCQCGKTVSTGLQTSGTKIASKESDAFFKFVATFPSRKKAAYSPTIDQWDQHDTVCPDCRVKKLPETFKSHATPMKPNAKVTRDQEICTCPPATRDQKSKQKSDQSCMAKIPKSRADRIPRKGMADKNIDDRCPCTADVETGVPGVVKKMRCACGEVD